MKQGIIIFISVVIAGLLCGAAYFTWWAKRNINYKFMYKELVQQTVREMVKEEALK